MPPIVHGKICGQGLNEVFCTGAVVTGMNGEKINITDFGWFCFLCKSFGQYRLNLVVSQENLAIKNQPGQAAVIGRNAKPSYSVVQGSAPVGMRDIVIAARIFRDIMTR